MALEKGSDRFAESASEFEPAPSRVGRVVAVCASSRGGIPKYPQDRVTVGRYGVEGDYHAKATKPNRHTDQEEPNGRQISIASREMEEEISAQLGVNIPAGGFGENVSTAGLGDLSDLAPGDELRFSSGVVLEVTAQIGPCKNLSVYHRLVPRLSYGRRGVVAMVIRPGPLVPGDSVTVHKVSSSPMGPSA